MMQEMLRLCEAENGTTTDEVLQAGASGHTIAGRNVATNSGSRGRQSSCKGGKTWNIDGPKRRITRKGYQRLLNKFEMEGYMAQKGLWNLARNKKLARQRCFAKGRRRHHQRVEGNA